MALRTKIKVNMTFTPDVPQDVVFVIKGLFGMLDESSYDETLRFEKLISVYGPEFEDLFYKRKSNFYIDPDSGCWVLKAEGEIKNYEDEVYQFFGLVDKYTNDDIIGSTHYEECDEPSLQYSNAYLKNRKRKVYCA